VKDAGSIPQRELIYCCIYTQNMKHGGIKYFKSVELLVVQRNFDFALLDFTVFPILRTFFVDADQKLIITISNFKRFHVSSKLNFPKFPFYFLVVTIKISSKLYIQHPILEISNTGSVLLMFKACLRKISISLNCHDLVSRHGI
jgi:hypothetical protein